MVQSFLYLKQKKPNKNDLIIRVVTVEVKSKASVPSCVNVITLAELSLIIIYQDDRTSLVTVHDVCVGC